MLAEEFTKPLPRAVFKDKQARIEVLDVGGVY